MWAAEAHGQAKSLGYAHGDICAPRSGGVQQALCERVDGGNHQGTGGMCGVRKCCETVTKSAKCVGRLHDHGAQVILR